MKYMEKKNMVLLTVIAVATLLVAVVGATFAYFTAQSTTTGNSTTTEARTATLASLTWTNGTGSGESPAVYPGYMAYQSYELEAGGTSGSAFFELNLVGTVPSALTGAINYTVYRTTTSAPNYSLEGVWNPGTPLVEQTTEGETPVTKYSITGASFNKDTAGMNQVATGTLTQGSTSVTTSEEVQAGAHYYYVLVLEYEDNGAEQNTQQGQDFDAKLQLTARASA